MQYFTYILMTLKLLFPDLVLWLLINLKMFNIHKIEILIEAMLVSAAKHFQTFSTNMPITQHNNCHAERVQC